MALAANEIERNAKAPVDVLELGQAELDKLLPQGEVLRVAALQLHQLAPGLVQPLLVLLRPLVALDVHPLQLLDRRGLQRFGFEEMPVPHDQDAELRAPVAEMVVRDHPVSKESVHPVERIADDRRADMPDVHGLGHVGAGVVDDHGMSRAGAGHTQPLVPLDGLQVAGQVLRLEEEVDEPGSRDLHPLHPLRTQRLVHQRLGHLARGLLENARQRHGRIALVVAKRVVSRRHDRQGHLVQPGMREQRAEGLPRPGRQDRFGGLHIRHSPVSTALRKRRFA